MQIRFCTFVMFHVWHFEPHTFTTISLKLYWMFLCKWRARKQISLHRDNKVVLYYLWSYPEKGCYLCTALAAKCRSMDALPVYNLGSKMQGAWTCYLSITWAAKWRGMDVLPVRQHCCYLCITWAAKCSVMGVQNPGGMDVLPVYNLVRKIQGAWMCDLHITRAAKCRWLLATKGRYIVFACTWLKTGQHSLDGTAKAWMFYLWVKGDRIVTKSGQQNPGGAGKGWLCPWIIKGDEVGTCALTYN